MKPPGERTFLIDTKRKLKMQSINRVIWRCRDGEVGYFSKPEKLAFFKKWFLIG